MIEEILSINLSAEPQFLARFADGQLFEYLTHLRVLSTPRLTGNAERYEKYFRNLPAIAGPRPRWRCHTEHAEEIAIDDQAGPANDAQPAAAAGEPAQEPATQANSLAAARDKCHADAETAPETHATAEAAPEAHATAVAKDTSCQELVAQDVDLAVGQAEREQLLSTPAELADAPAVDDEPDEANMETPFKIAAPPRRTASARAAASTAARHMLYGADAPQPPPRPRRRAKSCAPATVATVPPARGPQGQADQSGQDDLDDEKWPY
jgi:hypothetical protein